MPNKNGKSLKKTHSNLNRSRSLITRAKSLSSVQALLVVLVVAAVGIVAVTSSLAAKSGGGHTSGSSVSLVMTTDQNGDGLPNYGDSVFFKVSTTATNAPNVALECWQNGAEVYYWTVGEYPWYPWSQNFILASTPWTSGAANCTATASYQSNKRTVQLATLNFNVSP